MPAWGVNPKYFLDMGWEDIMLAVEYDGDGHRTSRPQFVKDLARLEYLQQRGWTHIAAGLISRCCPNTAAPMSVAVFSALGTR